MSPPLVHVPCTSRGFPLSAGGPAPWGVPPCPRPCTREKCVPDIFLDTDCSDTVYSLDLLQQRIARHSITTSDLDK